MQSEIVANKVYIADTLYKYFPEIFKELFYIFGKYNINNGIINGTKDIWCRDYMPVQNNKFFIKFNYKPDHLLLEEQERGLTELSDIDINKLEIPYFKEKLITLDIIAEGGNFIKGKDIVFVCDKIFKDNPKYNPENLKRIISDYFGKVIIIPQIPGEIIGHSDGMIRYTGNNTVLINNWKNIDKYRYFSFINILESNDLRVIELPNRFNDNDNMYSDVGDYINYLIVKDVIVMQKYGYPEDRKATKIIEKVFPEHKIEFIDCNKLGLLGGGLNCCTWTINE